MASPKLVKYLPLTGKTKVEPGDEYNPWNTGWKRLPPSYGWPVSVAPGSVFRRPVRPARIQQSLRELI